MNSFEPLSVQQALRELEGLDDLVQQGRLEEAIQLVNIKWSVGPATDELKGNIEYLRQYADKWSLDAFVKLHTFRKGRDQINGFDVLDPAEFSARQGRKATKKSFGYQLFREMRFGLIASANRQRICDRLISVIASPQLAATILGDLEERFSVMARESSSRNATRWYCREVFHSLVSLAFDALKRVSGIERLFRRIG